MGGPKCNPQSAERPEGRQSAPIRNPRRNPQSASARRKIGDKFLLCGGRTVKDIFVTYFGEPWRPPKKIGDKFLLCSDRTVKEIFVTYFGEPWRPPSGPAEVPPSGPAEVPPSGPAEAPPSGPPEVPPSGPAKVPPSGHAEVPPAELKSRRRLADAWSKRHHRPSRI